MEFPSLGQHCHQNDCKQLDFLPMKCDACSEIFCKDHIQYTSHSCPESYKKDNQVPVCPLCNSLVPVKKGETPDVIVGRHIDNDCKSDTAQQRRKIYTNKCSFKGCKQKELIPVQCEKCRKNFCLRHRFEDDHDCSGFEGSGKGMSRQGAAALARLEGTKSSSSSAQPKKPTNPPPQQRTSQLSSIGSQLNRERQERQSQGRQLTQDQARSAQAGMSEEEAMARAIQMSLAESQKTQQNDHTLSQEDEDLLLAQALAASEEEARRERQRRQQQQSQRQSQNSNKSTCGVS